MSGASPEAATSLFLNAGGGAKREEPDASSTPNSAGLQPAEPFSALSLELESDPSRRILSDTTGLRPSFLDDYMRYTAVEGDSWSILAQRFYQDGRYTRNLIRANDDLVELTPGTEILVPVFDFLADESGTARPGATPILASSPAPAKPRESAPTGSGKSSSRALEYEVKAGDTLSDISLAVFGTATRWKELLDANQGTLRSPEALQVGMKLKIPEGGKLPAAGAARSVAKKPEAKPAQPAKSEAPKKKKVL